MWRMATRLDNTDLISQIKFEKEIIYPVKTLGWEALCKKVLTISTTIFYLVDGEIILSPHDFSASGRNSWCGPRYGPVFNQAFVQKDYYMKTNFESGCILQKWQSISPPLQQQQQFSFDSLD
jgi:hypothetical protein